MSADDTGFSGQLGTNDLPALHEDGSHFASNQKAYELTVVRAVNLLSPSISAPNLWVQIEVDSRVFCTREVSNVENPLWNSRFYFKTQDATSNICFRVQQSPPLGSSEPVLLGFVEIGLDQLTGHHGPDAMLRLQCNEKQLTTYPAPYLFVRPSLEMAIGGIAYGRSNERNVAFNNTVEIFGPILGGDIGRVYSDSPAYGVNDSAAVDKTFETFGPILGGDIGDRVYGDSPAYGVDDSAVVDETFEKFGPVLEGDTGGMAYDSGPSCTDGGATAGNMFGIFGPAQGPPGPSTTIVSDPPTSKDIILLPASSQPSGGCNNATAADFSIPQIIEVTGRECSLIDAIREACLAVGLRECNCSKLQESLEHYGPSCASWPGLECWVLQLAACICAQAAEKRKQSRLVQSTHDLSTMVRKYKDILVPTTTSSSGKTAEVNLFEVLSLIAWLDAIATGKYEPITEPEDRDKWDGWDLVKSDDLFVQPVNEAIQRAATLGLCPRRVWAVASNLPGCELNLPALIPRVNDLHFPVSKHGADHQYCTPEFCEESATNSTAVAQLHLCNDENNCTLTDPQMFMAAKLDSPARNGQSTAWALDGRTVLAPRQPFMAISHVWADGTGVGLRTHGRVNACLHRFFREIASEYDCDGLWWDTVSIPSDKAARTAAINNMNQNYEQAKWTIVHDRYLLGSPWVNAESGCFALVMSPWFTRGWTALELAMSKHGTVLVLFGSQDPRDKYVIKNLDEDILAKEGEPCSPSCLVALMAVRALRRKVEEVNDILTSLGPRFTSWVRDRAIIAAHMVNVQLPPLDQPITQQQIYRMVIQKVGKVHDAHLFHERETVGRTWLPKSLFDLPLAPTTAQPLEILPNGDVVGEWRMLDSTADNDPFGTRSGTKFNWFSRNRSFRELHVKHVIMSRQKNHIILVERNVKFPMRGLLVEAMNPPESSQDSAGFILYCQYVGCVHFLSNRLRRAGIVKVRIGDMSGLSGFSGSVRETWYDHHGSWPAEERLGSIGVHGYRHPDRE